MQNETSINDRRGIFLMLLSVLLFAINTLIVRGVEIYDPAADGWMATCFRGAIGLVVVACLYGGRGLALKRLLGSKLIFWRGVIGAIGLIAFYITIQKLGAGRAVILNLTYPAFGTLFAAWWLKESITRAAGMWMFIGLLGLLVFLSGDGSLLQFSAYDLLAILGAVAAGLVIVIIRRLRNEEHPSTIYASQAFYSLLAAAPAVPKLGMLTAYGWVGLAVAAVLVAFGQLLMTRAYQQLPVSRGSAIQMLLPLVVAAGGALLFQEKFTLVELAGAALTLLATWRVVVAK